jgi:hypothetical protein
MHNEKIQLRSRKVDPEDFGLLLSKTCSWDGELIFRACLAALEDSNFHRVSRELISAWESVEGPL